MEWWHETTECLMSSPKTHGAKVRRIAQKALGKTRKVGAEGESLYLGKGFSKNTSPTEPAYKLL